jgi:hypothetical protein
MSTPKDKLTEIENGGMSPNTPAELTPLTDTTNFSPPKIPGPKPKSKSKAETQVYSSTIKPSKKEDMEGKIGYPGMMAVNTVKDENGKLLAYSIDVDNEKGNVHDVSHLNISHQDFMRDIDAIRKTAMEGAENDIGEGREPRNIGAETKDIIEAKYQGKVLNMSFADYNKQPISSKNEQEEKTSPRP